MDKFERDLVLLIPKLRSRARHISKSLAYVEDLVQDTILRMLERRDIYKEQGNFSGWAYTVMMNIWRSDMRRNNKSKEIQVEILPEVPVPPMQENNLNTKEMIGILKKLPHHQREILILCEVQDMKYKDAAEQLNIPIGTVRSRMSRAKSTLKKRSPTSPPAGHTG